MCCLPFGEALYRELQQRGLDAETIWHDRPRFGRGPLWPRDGEQLEDHLRWLITIGVLRRKWMAAHSLPLTPWDGTCSRTRLLPPAGWNNRLRQALRRRVAV